MPNPVDIPLALAELVPDAQYTRAGTYAELQASWTDARPIPTFGQIQSAWATAEAKKNARDIDRNRGQAIVQSIGDGDINKAIFRLTEAIGDPAVAADVAAKLAAVKVAHPKP